VRRALVALAVCACGTIVAASAAFAEPAEAVAEAEAVLDAFQAALVAGDREGALARLAPEVVIFEAGGAELSRDEYAHHHLAGDMEYLAATRTERVDRRSGTSGELVWALTRSKASGDFRGRPVATLGTETALLARTPDGWRIVHLHWSSREVRTP